MPRKLGYGGLANSGLGRDFSGKAPPHDPIHLQIGGRISLSIGIGIGMAILLTFLTGCVVFF